MEIHHSRVASFTEWRDAARSYLTQSVPPERIRWNEEPEIHLELEFPAEEASDRQQPPPRRVPNSFLSRAKRVACHNHPDTWSLLYRMTWRIAREGETHLLQRASDPDVAAFTLKEKAIRRERHKMTAFVRFRKVAAPHADPDNRETYIAWYEPEHDVVRLAAPFFRDRFASMHWSILTPRTSVHWDGSNLRFTENARKEEAPPADELELYWKRYYASIFNPARLNMPMMEREMPRRYWKNLPEADLIAELASGSYGREQSMRSHQEDNSERRERRPRGAPDGAEHHACASPEEIRLRTENLTLPSTQALALACQACPLYHKATQTVWGEGPHDARLMIIGEQPGDQEDIAGRPFVGPAGALLRQALADVGLDPQDIYFTNAVKHFKWTATAKQRLHKKASAAEADACRPWLEKELQLIKPKVVLCLGSTAAQAILRHPVSITRERGIIDDIGLPYQVALTYHPAYLLRLPTKDAQQKAAAAFSADLTLAKHIVEK